MAMGKCRECGRQVAKSAASCPGCGVKKPVKRTSLVTLAAAAGCCVVALRMCSGTGSKTVATPVAAAAMLTTPGKLPPDAVTRPIKLPTLTAAKLLQAYRVNEVKADLQYKGKRFHVTGMVMGVSSDIADEPQVELVTDLSGVVASGIRREFAATLNKGDLLEADCVVDGEVLGSPMLDCSR